MIRGGGEPVRVHGPRTAIEIGATTEELRFRCSWLHHGYGSRIGSTECKVAARTSRHSELPSDRPNTKGAYHGLNLARAAKSA